MAKTYVLLHKPSFNHDFIALSKDLQRRVTNAFRDLEQEPTTPRGDTIKKLKGWKDLWRYRIDDYRLIYHVPAQKQIVLLLAIGPRKDVYQRFYYDPDTDEDLNSIAYSDLTDVGPTQDVPEWHRHPEWFQPPRAARTNKPLPQRLTPVLLNQWGIPPEF